MAAGVRSLLHGGNHRYAFRLAPVAGGWRGLGFLQVLAPVLPLVVIALGVFFLVVSWGLWKGLGWAWLLAIVASRSFSMDKLVGLVVILGILAYLSRPRIRAYFREP